MKKRYLLLSMMLLSANVFAVRLQDHIQSISMGKNGEDHLIKMRGGRVIFLSDQDPTFDPRDFYSGDKIEFEVDDKSNLMAVSSLEESSCIIEKSPRSQLRSNSEASVISSDEANHIFNGMNRHYKNKSECTDRAQVWAFEAWKNHGLYSRKVFLFFTDTFIRRYHYGWWFHVSPYIYVNDGNETFEQVMDRRYTSGPRTMKSWTDRFIYSKQDCPTTTYRYYRNHKNGSNHCFLVKSDMYYRLPYHVRMLEDYGRVKTHFSLSEVNFSYRAFTQRNR